MGKLSDKKLRSLRPAAKSYQLADGDGLYVEVLPSGVLSFRFQYRLDGRKEKVVLGTYPALPLAAARQKHREFLTMVALGKSPANAIRAGKAIRRAERSGHGTFKVFAETWVKQWAAGTLDSKSSPKPKAARTVRQVDDWLNQDIYPVLGDLQVTEVKPTHVLEVVDRVKDRGAAQSARKIRGYLRQIFDHGINRLLIETNPVDRIRAKSVATQKARDRALSKTEITRFFRALERDGGKEQTKLAFRLLLRTLVRKSELLTATSSQFDLEAAEWAIPPEATKNRKGHWVPLSRQDVEALKRLQEIACGEPYVLPHNNRPGEHMSGSTLNETVNRLLRTDALKGMPHFTVHDLRRTAATHLNEAGFPGDWVERALNHDLPGVRGIYVRSEYREQRRQMLQQWADIVDAWIAGAEVVPFRSNTAA